jgi:hypothetical protein
MSDRRSLRERLSGRTPEDIAEFKKEANSGQDPDFKAFASKTFPTLERHLSMAEQTSADRKKYLPKVVEKAGGWHLSLRLKCGLQLGRV